MTKSFKSWAKTTSNSALTKYVRLLVSAYIKDKLSDDDIQAWSVRFEKRFGEKPERILSELPKAINVVKINGEIKITISPTEIVCGHPAKEIAQYVRFGTLADRKNNILDNALAFASAMLRTED